MVCCDCYNCNKDFDFCPTRVDLNKRTVSSRSSTYDTYYASDYNKDQKKRRDIRKKLFKEQQLKKTIEGYKKPVTILKPQHKIKPKIRVRNNLKNKS